MRHLTVLVAMAVAFSAAGIATAVPYYFTVLNPTEAGGNSWANAMALVSGAAEMVGVSGNSSYANWHPVSWSSSGVATNLLPLIPGASAGAIGVAQNAANGVDSNGDIVGQTFVSGVPIAFYIPGGGTGVVLPNLDPTNPWACATSVCDSGTIVGSSYNGTWFSTVTNSTQPCQNACVWTAGGGVVDFGRPGTPSCATGISPNGNTIIGDIGPVLGTAVEWTKSGSTWTMAPLGIQPNSPFSQAMPYGINNSGVLVGSAYLPSQNGMPPSPISVGFQYQQGGTPVQYTDIPGSNYPGISANAINQSGVVVGSNSEAAFVDYSGAAGGVVNLQTLVPSAASATWNLWTASAVDDNGDIAGQLCSNDGAYKYAGYFLQPAIAGDANVDGMVDINDLTIVLAHYGQTGLGWAQGEFTGDGTVDINDLTIVLAHYGQSEGTSAGVINSAPEPAALVLLGAGATAVLASSRRRRKRLPDRPAVRWGAGPYMDME